MHKATSCLFKIWVAITTIGFFLVLYKFRFKRNNESCFLRTQILITNWGRKTANQNVMLLDTKLEITKKHFKVTFAITLKYILSYQEFFFLLWLYQCACISCLLSNLSPSLFIFIFPQNSGHKVGLLRWTHHLSGVQQYRNLCHTCGELIKLFATFSESSQKCILLDIRVQSHF